MRKAEPAGKQLRFSCYGVAIVVNVGVGISLARVRSVLPPASTAITGNPEEHVFSLLRTERDFKIRGGTSRSATFEKFADALNALRQRLHLCVAEHVVDHVFVHAGVVSWYGRAIVCPGVSYAGKSTLIWSLIQAGAMYYSDEYAVFDRTGKVYPFPLPLGRRQPAGRRRTIIIRNAGVKPIGKHLLLFSRYRKSGHWAPASLTPAEAVLRLMKNAPAMRRNPRVVLQTLKEIALRCKAFASPRGEASEVLNWLVLNLPNYPGKHS